MAKSATFGTLHLGIAFGVCYAFTGDWLAASAYTAIEPAANTVAHHFFDRWWARSGGRSAWAKALLFGLMHLAIAFGVCWALTGSVLAASAQTVVEPLVNMVALVVFDRWWQRRPRPSGKGGLAAAWVGRADPSSAFAAAPVPRAPAV